MVGLVNDSTIKVTEEEEKEPIQPAELQKSIDPLDFSLPELEDLSLSFADSFLDFDGLKDWIEENSYMADLKTDPGMVDIETIEFGVFDRNMEVGKEKFSKGTKVEDGSGRLGNLGSLIEEELGKVSLEGVPDGSIVVNANGTNKSNEFVGIDGNGVKSDVIITVKCEGEENGEIVGVVGDGVMSSLLVTVKCEGEKNGDIVCVVGDDVNGNTLTVDNNGSKRGEIVSNGEESASESESESASASSSSSSSSSSSEDDDEEKNGEEKEEGEMDLEEGEIRDSFGEEMVAWSYEEDEGLGSIKAGPIMSKNEFLPPVPPVDVTLQPCHQTLPVGVVLSIVGAQVVVEGVEKHNPLNEGSILWITEKRSSLGIVDEIFGPVKNPYYIVRYNSDSEVPTGIQLGTLISFIPEFANHVLNNGNLYKKGYDASGENDEELSDEAEFSDDEKETEYQSTLEMSKGGTKDQTVETRKKRKKKFKNRGGQWESDHPSATQPTGCVGQLPFDQNQHFIPPATASVDQGNCSRSSGTVQGFCGGLGLVPLFPQLAQVPGFTSPSSGVWVNGVPCQQPQHMGFPNGIPPNNMQWTQQNNPQQPYQTPLPNGVLFQQHFSTSQMLPPNFIFPGGQPSFCARPTFAPWNPLLIGQNSFNQSQAAMGIQGQRASLSMNIGEQGVSSSGLQMDRERGFPPPSVIPGNTGASQNINRGADFGRGRKPYRRGRGRYGGGRGRQQAK